MLDLKNQLLQRLISILVICIFGKKESLPVLKDELIKK
ncbi:MAG: hypothetical protein QG670_2759 [Thermoproteota archaeon]|nr:hypothetical protein [Thermoproteota archaeon]